MSWKLSNLASVSRLRGTLAFRLAAGYALAGLILVFFATASLYLVLSSELEKSTELFLGDKVHVVSTMLRERGYADFSTKASQSFLKAARFSAGTLK